MPTEQSRKYGLLLNEKNIKLHRKWFKQMTKLIGVNCIYQAPRDSKEFDLHGELDTKYYEPITDVGCIFEEYPDQKTLKKMGWVAELQEGSSIIHVPYDLDHLQVGALFTLPAAFDGAPGRVFRVVAMQAIMIYPASIACEIAPEYKTEVDSSTVEQFASSDFNVLVDYEEDD